MKNIYGIMEPVLTGKQDYRNVIEYKGWEKSIQPLQITMVDF